MAVARPSGEFDVEFALLVEHGSLEAQACLLVESLRRFGGRHAEAPVTVVSPRPSRRPSAETMAMLRGLGAHYEELDLANCCPDYPSSWRVHALAQLEQRPGPGVLVQVDSDTLFCADIGPLCDDTAACARPVDIKGMSTSGAGDPYEPLWAELCRLSGVDLAALPFVTATVDRARIRANHNGGFVAARRKLGLFVRTEEVFRLAARADLRPHAGAGTNVVAGAGVVSTAGSEWWGLSQAATSVAAASLGVELAPIDLAINVPMHSWAELEPRPDAVRHAHYHWLLADPLPAPNPMLDGGSPTLCSHGCGRGSRWPRPPADRHLWWRSAARVQPGPPNRVGNVAHVGAAA